MKTVYFKKIHTATEIEQSLTQIPDMLASMKKRVVLNEHFEKLAANADSFVLMEKEELKALACIYANDRITNTAFITLIACVPNARHSGYGGKIFEYISEFARQQGMTVLRLEVAKNNVNAIAFYEKHGMKTVGTTEHGWIMQKEL